VMVVQAEPTSYDLQSLTKLQQMSSSPSPKPLLLGIKLTIPVEIPSSSNEKTSDEV